MMVKAFKDKESQEIYVVGGKMGVNGVFCVGAGLGKCHKAIG
jgi:hypothetical protein